MSNAKKIIVLGALSAIAEATMRLLAEEGASFALFARDSARLEAVAQDLRLRGAPLVHAVSRDLAAPGDPRPLLEEARQALGGADAILLFYGLLGDQAKADRDHAEAMRILEVNFTSAAGWMLAGAELLEAHGAPGASLIAVSSVAGDRGRRSNYVYGAAKGGLALLMQGIAHRFGKQGRLRAVTMKLGFVDTPMTAGLAAGGPLWAKPEQVARAIRAALDRGGPVVYAPGFWRLIMLAIRLTPHAVFRRVNL